MEDVDLAVIVLAAGKGTRMKSDLPKVLHKIESKCLINYVLECAEKIAQKNIHVVVGHQAEKVKAQINKYFSVTFALQENMHGTGDAVKIGLKGLPKEIKNVLVLNGDVPFIKESTLAALINIHKKKENLITLLTVNLDDPTGYGRVIQDVKGKMVCIKEESDASFEERRVTKVNTGIYCFDREFLEYAIPRIESKNIQKEYYLTDVVEIAINKGMKTGLISAQDWREVIGINNLMELENAKVLLKEIGL
jgi:bifunctional UDP-N-acetylglucosamine pyrophosphorylase/glucosamine-1-phosphate N-acetyltransferase/UDP-N-acetylglucosamine pyrophosphorylase